MDYEEEISKILKDNTPFNSSLLIKTVHICNDDSEIPSGQLCMLTSMTPAKRQQALDIFNINLNTTIYISKNLILSGAFKIIKNNRSIIIEISESIQKYRRNGLKVRVLNLIYN